MPTYLDEKVARDTAPPADGKPHRIEYDGDDPKAVKGFGLRVTKAGARSFILNYRNSEGRERRLTIGAFPDWKVVAAREEARRLKREIDQGIDPMGERHDLREAPTLKEFAESYIEARRGIKRERTVKEDESLLNGIILPELGARKIAGIGFRDVEALHLQVTKNGTPIRANRAVALLSNIFAKAIKEGLRADNPAKGIERNQEQPRERYLTNDETVRLMKALTKHRAKPSANAVMLLLLTGARRSEVLTATWGQFDLGAGTWTKPGSSTKQKTVHRVPLNPQALTLLRAMKPGKAPDFLFPGLGEKSETQTEIKTFWRTLLADAEIEDFRLHDLRHSFASLLVNNGLGLPVIGRLLGHRRTETTARYAHLFDETLSSATRKLGRAVAMASPRSRSKRAAR
ncbi:MAG TPA: tyrosine-type recombinase/integrase [Stellaceae bacterium]|nr:tyrosine-type recombinase/integrase [Stellaceae bacterium]